MNRCSMVFLLLTAIFFAGCVEDDSSSKGNVVAISGTKGQWKILVNGEPFELKGVGAGRLTDKDSQADFLRLAKEMGANTVRTWGISQGTKEYLDKAHKLGLYVDAGIWMNIVEQDGTCSYLYDEECKARMRTETLDYVRTYKDHPAVLFWNIGNETFFWTKDDEERVAFAHYLEHLIKEVKEIDPDHPVVYASAFDTAVEYVQHFIPSLDIFGVNAYGGLEQIHHIVTEKMDIPYMVTEYGPLGSWDRGKDVNGRPVELTDQSKASYYKKLGHTAESYRGYCLGAFPFYLGEATDTGLTWWNLTYKQYKKLSYLVLQEFYTGQKSADVQLANIVSMELSKRKGLRPAEPFEINVKTDRPSSENTEYRYFASTDLDFDLTEFSNAQVPLEVAGSGAEVEAKAPQEPGIYRIYAVAITDGRYASTLSKTISVVQP